jgi:glutamyl-tRNA synthetase
MTTPAIPAPRPVRVRIAPSPTGPLHIGTARTALFNALFAKGHSGAFIVRIEDTDAARSEISHEQDILAGLAALGLTWDEGPDPEGGPDIGPFAPYRQSQRSEHYQGALTYLLAHDRAYRCYCSPAELSAERDAAKAAGWAPRYSGRCANLSERRLAALSAQGRAPVIRFRVGTGPIAFDDLIRGHVEIDAADLGGDFVIARSDGSPLYHFSVVVDDADMEISHVIRGEDHLSNTPKHVLLFRALDAPVPVFAHLPLILNADRSKMSKRDLAGTGDTDKIGSSVSSKLSDYLTEGYLPEALINYLALLGWSTGTTEEILSFSELAARFELGQVNRAGAVFDRKRLLWLNGQWIRRLEPADLAERLVPYFDHEFCADRIDDDPTVRQLTALVPLVTERLAVLSDIGPLTNFLFRYRVEPTLTQLIPSGWEAEKSIEALRATLDMLSEPLFHLDFDLAVISAALVALASSHGWKNSPYFGLLRAAISAQAITPPLAGCLVVLGPAATFTRLEYAIEVLESAQR